MFNDGNVNRTDIQAEKPVPPWERPGCFRLDCEPHRGNFLWWLGCAGFVLGVLALVPCCGWQPGLLGIPFGLCNRYMMKRDLAKMRAGTMDPAGAVVTTQAENLSRLGLWFSIAGTVVWGGIVLVFSWLIGPGER
ncbi:MAG TPA: hypothetical protein VN688_16585 [Gemmataceae bacterium]|nr:hypothetical protein [Gemmataceae bacterium]